MDYGAHVFFRAKQTMAGLSKTYNDIDTSYHVLDFASNF